MSVPAPASDMQARRWPSHLSSGLFLVFLTSHCVFLGRACAQPVAADTPGFTRPIAAAWIDSAKTRLAVTRQGKGSIAIVQAFNHEVPRELAIGRQLVDIVADPQGRWLIAVDEQKHELVFLNSKNASLDVVARWRVSPFPVDISIANSGRHAYVTSLWSRNVTVLNLFGDATTPTISQRQVISVPFNPGRVLGGDGRTLLVADAFGDRIYEIQIDEQKAAAVLGSKNMPGSGVDLDYRFVKSAELGLWYQVRRGQEYLENAHTSMLLGPASEPTPSQRGAALFYRRSSVTGKSCHDCHVHGHTSYELSDTLADGTSATPKRIPTLLGTRLSDPWAWNGKFRNLDEQVRSSLETTMHVTNFTPEQVGDLTAFLHTLKPPPPLEPATEDPADQAKLARGKQLFSDLGCAKCHVPPLTYTSADTYDVGLADEAGQTKFNPPSLRGVSQGYSFFHDGRAKSLEEVFKVYGHQLERPLSDQGLADLLRFLRSL